MYFNLQELLYYPVMNRFTVTSSAVITNGPRDSSRCTAAISALLLFNSHLKCGKPSIWSVVAHPPLHID